MTARAGERIKARRKKEAVIHDDKNKTKQKRIRQHRRALDKQYVEGECVWNALLRGIADLEEEGCGKWCNHRNLLRRLQSELTSQRKTPSDGDDFPNNEIPVLFDRRPVKWNGDWLTTTDYIEIRKDMLETTVQTRGYDCRACDPLLVTFAAVFRLRIVHDFDGVEIRDSTRDPLRIVYLSSSRGNMDHDRNEDVGGTAEEDKTDSHSGAEDTVCGICGVLFPSEKNMLRHRQSRHEKASLIAHTGTSVPE